MPWVTENTGEEWDMSRAVVEALVWETERARREFADFLRALPPETWDKRVEGKQGSVKGVVAHVCAAGYYFIRAVMEANQLPVPPARYPDVAECRDAEVLMAALEDVRDVTFAAARALEDHHLRTRFATRWGHEYSGEILFEHGLVHILRHRRQLERIVMGAIPSWWE
jgi:uncharacterized damage-inducible protein DinB